MSLMIRKKGALIIKQKAIDAYKMHINTILDLEVNNEDHSK